MENSNIEWCDHTHNHWEGCTKVSPGCAHCYAEARNKRFGGGTSPNWGKGASRRLTSAANRLKPLQWNRRAGLIQEEIARGSTPYVGPKHRPRVFCSSLADWLDEEVPIEWLADLLDLIRLTPNLDWLLLTKRPQNWAKRLNAVYMAPGFDEARENWILQWTVQREAPANVWLGTTVEDQTRADERIPQLLSIPARVRFLSCEPLLGPVEFSNVTHRSDCVAQLGKPALSGIHWVICGGESGPKARPMHPAWARSIRDQCAAVGVPFHFKQWGEWLPDRDRQFTTSGNITWGLVHKSGTFRLVLNKGGRDWLQDTGWKDGEEGTTEVGKRTAGRYLDGIIHNAFPL